MQHSIRVFLTALAFTWGTFGEPQRSASSSPHVDPMSLSETQLLNMRGDFGTYVPGLTRCPVDPDAGIRCTGDDGATARGVERGLIFSISVYPPERRKAFYDAYTDGLLPNGRTRDYTHLPVGPFRPCSGRRGYHGIYPEGPCTGEAINALLREMWDHQVGGVSRPIVPICFAMADGASDVQLPDGVDKSLCRVVVPKWEHPAADCDLQRTRAAFPAALLLWHNPASNASTPANFEGVDFPAGDACYPTQSDGAAWYRHARDAYGLKGLLLQTNPWNRDVESTLARVRAVRKLLTPDMTLVLFETDIYVKFWNGLTEAESLAYNDAVLRHDSIAGMVQGFGNGSTLPRQD